jgi:hypothetical protein
MPKIYLASSWRNPFQPHAVELLRMAGHDVYDFRNPPDAGRGEVMGSRGTGSGFQWSEVDPNWQAWTAREYRDALKHPVAKRGFKSDLDGMVWADTCVLLLPCGRSAHLEAGWMAGQGKRTIVWTCDGQEPELMALLASEICVSIEEVLEALQ